MAKTTTTSADGDLQFGADEQLRCCARPQNSVNPPRGEGGLRLGHYLFPAA